MNGATPMPILRFGNDAPVEVQRQPDDSELRVPLEGPVVTTVGIPDDQDADGNLFPLWSIEETLMTLTHHQRGVVRMHTDANPAWVSCPDWPELEQRMAGFFGAAQGIQAGYGIDDELPPTPKKRSQS